MIRWLTARISIPQMKFNYNKLDAEGNYIQIGTQQSQIWHLERVWYYGLDLENNYARTNATH